MSIKQVLDGVDDPMSPLMSQEDESFLEDCLADHKGIIADVQRGTPMDVDSLLLTSNCGFCTDGDVDEEAPGASNLPGDKSVAESVNELTILLRPHEHMGCAQLPEANNLFSTARIILTDEVVDADLGCENSLVDALIKPSCSSTDNAVDAVSSDVRQVQASSISSISQSVFVESNHHIGVASTSLALDQVHEDMGQTGPLDHNVAVSDHNVVSKVPLRRTRSGPVHNVAVTVSKVPLRRTRSGPVQKPKSKAAVLRLADPAKGRKLICHQVTGPELHETSNPAVSYIDGCVKSIVWTEKAKYNYLHRFLIVMLLGGHFNVQPHGELFRSIVRFCDSRKQLLEGEVSEDHLEYFCFIDSDQFASLWSQYKDNNSAAFSTVTDALKVCMSKSKYFVRPDADNHHKPKLLYRFSLKGIADVAKALSRFR